MLRRYPAACDALLLGFQLVHICSCTANMHQLDLGYVLGWFLDGNRLYMLRIGTDAWPTCCLLAIL